MIKHNHVRCLQCPQGRLPGILYSSAALAVILRNQTAYGREPISAPELHPITALQHTEIIIFPVFSALGSTLARIQLRPLNGNCLFPPSASLVRDEKKIFRRINHHHRPLIAFLGILKRPKWLRQIPGVLSAKLRLVPHGDLEIKSQSHGRGLAALVDDIQAGYDV